MTAVTAEARGTFFQLRMGPAELARWRDGAWRRHITLADLVRAAVESELERLDAPEQPRQPSFEERLAELGFQI